ncbi:MAG: hypothetical protein ACFFBD_21305 [Candidatus Hodarchaeota archaeon]
MSLAITSGALSYSQKLSSISPEWKQIANTLRQLPFDYEITMFDPERQEILLKFENSSTFDPEIIREFLKKLQHLSQCSFVALVNMASQCVLITVRG